MGEEVAIGRWQFWPESPQRRPGNYKVLKEPLNPGSKLKPQQLLAWPVLVSQYRYHFAGHHHAAQTSAHLSTAQSQQGQRQTAGSALQQVPDGRGAAAPPRLLRAQPLSQPFR